MYPILIEELAILPPVIILTGNVQEGKTGFLVRLIKELKKDGIKMGGFIARGIHENDQRIGYDLESIADGSSMIFIRNKVTAGWFRHGKYHFNPAGEAFGNKILQNLPEQGLDLVIIDEIGPIEVKGLGWAGEVGKMVEKKWPLQLWVVRRQLLKRVSRQWKIGNILLIDVSTDTVDEARVHILKFMRKQSDNIIL